MNYVRIRISISKIIAKCELKIFQNETKLGNALFKDSLEKPLSLLLEENETLRSVIQVFTILHKVLLECSSLDAGFDQNFIFTSQRQSFFAAARNLITKLEIESDDH